MGMLADSGLSKGASPALDTDRMLGDFPPMLKKFPGLLVLVVDDEPLIRWSLAETLGDGGCDVLEAADGHTALQMLKETPTPVDVIMLDYRLPDSESLDLLSAIRRLSPVSQVVLMTAFSTPEVAAGALRLGAFCVVGKPLEMQDVAALVSRAHGSRTA